MTHVFAAITSKRHGRRPAIEQFFGSISDFCIVKYRPSFEFITTRHYNNALDFSYSKSLLDDVSYHK
jgi:hypothetical protein